MNLLLDQDVYAITARHLRAQGHNVMTASDLGRSRASEEALLSIAHQQGRLFVTRDRDLGGLVFVRAYGAGVIYLRSGPLIVHATAGANETHRTMIAARTYGALRSRATTVLNCCRSRCRNCLGSKE